MAEEKEQYLTVPDKITDKSFQIIQQEIEQRMPGKTFDSPLQEAVVKRAIHTTADFDYLKNLKFTHNVLEWIQQAFMTHATIYTDTTMALAGMNKIRLAALQVSYQCLIRDERVQKLARSKKITRSMAAIEIAAQQPGKKIFVVGNAPTALYKIIEMVQKQTLQVEAVIGVPVGFVEAAESKAALMKSAIPSIVALGRKGGSNLAAALVNAIIYNTDV